MRRTLHGLELEVTGGPPEGLLVELLGGLPEGRPEAPADLLVRVAPALGPPPLGGRPLFHHGVVQATESHGAILLSDGASSALVGPGGASIDLAVSPASLADRHTLVHVLVLMALVVALRHRGLFHVHAAALRREDGRGILVAGAAGSGKSTLAVALVEHGLDYLGDDAAFLAAGPGGVKVLSFPRPFHLGGATVRAFPRLLPLLEVRDAAGTKRGLDPRSAFPGRARAEAGAPAVILLPEVGGQATTVIEPIPPAVALGALVESSAFLVVDDMPGVGEHFALLGLAVDGASSFSVRLGTDLLAEPSGVVARLLQAIRDAGP